jgi:hypothetical protein
MNLERILRKFLFRFPAYRAGFAYQKNECHTPGHFYSPVINIEDLAERKSKIWTEKSLAGINMNENVQLEFLNEIEKWFSLCPFPKKENEAFRYYLDNEWYPYADAYILFAMLNIFKPGQLMEVGSGFSSAATLDTNDRFLDGKLRMTFIDPNPQDRLDKLVKNSDRSKIKIIPDIVQNVPVEAFKTLQSNDILLIDSSHVVKTGSDVSYIINEILPALSKGVIIHFHDIFYPFEYPEKWIFEQKLNWNEAYMLQAFLQFNDSFEIIFFSNYMSLKYMDRMNETMPGFLDNWPGSIWLRKIK